MDTSFAIKRPYINLGTIGNDLSWVMRSMKEEKGITILVHRSTFWKIVGSMAEVYWTTEPEKNIMTTRLQKSVNKDHWRIQLHPGNFPLIVDNAVTENDVWYVMDQ